MTRLISTAVLLPLTVFFLVLIFHDLNISAPVDESRRSGADSIPRPAVCFAPDTPIEVIDAYYEAIARNAGDELPSPFQFNDGLRWSRTATNGNGLFQGDPTTITWSIVPDSTLLGALGSTPGESSAPSNLRAFLNGIYSGGESQWLPLFQEVFDRWEELTGNTYIYEPNDDGAAMTSVGNLPAGVVGIRGDVRIAGHFIDGNSGVLAYNFFPNTGDMVIDTGDNFFNNTFGNSLRLRNVLAHEHGHGLGLRHSCPNNETKLMEPFVSVAFDGPQHDDILGANRGYGDRFEPNDASNDATNLGQLQNGTIMIETVSIDDDSDVDWYAFTVPVNWRINVAVIPTGATYLSGPQLISGLCSAGTGFNSLIENDLSLEVIAPDGVTSLAIATDRPAGTLEQIIDLDLNESAGTYFIRVSGVNNRAQLYDLELEGALNEEAFPVVSFRSPAADSQLAGLTIVQVIFDKPVETFDADLMQVNGSLAQTVSGSGIGPFTFQGFDSPGHGPVLIELTGGTIQDQFGNIFQGETWTMEIQDCNGNGLLDRRDIQSGVGDDCNRNLIPDSCETGFVAADAGPDQTVGISDSVTIGGNPTANSGVPPYTFEWTLGGGADGEVRIESNPTYGPLEAGSYIATLVVTDASGCSAIDTMIVTVEGNGFVGPPSLFVTGNDCAQATNIAAGLSLMVMIVGTLSLRNGMRRRR